MNAPGRTACIVALCLFIAHAGLEAADTLRVVTHDAVTVVTDPSTGAKSYPAWGAFPSAGFSVRKATMRVTFGCPDSMRCADWDYLDRVVARRKGGALGDTLNHEIGRMLTPYGGAFARDWKFGWTVDVTDFVLLLRDSVEIDYIHTGYEQNDDRGWKITVAFEFIGGPPVAKPLSITRIYDGSYAYGDSARPISASLAPVTFRAADGAGFARLLVYQTGHGGDDSGCGEFCNKYREIVFDGKVEDRRQIWKECGDNPLSPQAGTWIYDRANWCPGNLLSPEAFDFPVKPGSTHTVDIEMEPYILPGTAAVEAITAYVVQYAPAAAENDVALVDIQVPSDQDPFRRSNPACAGARISFMNNGSLPVRSLAVRYGTLHFEDRFFTWEGSLAPGRTATIDLPGEIPQRVAGNSYRVTLISPNGVGDAWPDDNDLIVPFASTPAYRSPLVFLLKTNNQPEQTSWTLRRGDGTVVMEAKAETLVADKGYNSILTLDPGCYSLSIVDSAGDGLEFWYNVKGGRGFARLVDVAGKMLRSFESDFGSESVFNFRVTENQRLVTPPAPEPAISLFPTRTLGVTAMDYFSNAAARVSVKIVADPGGELVEEHEYPDLRSGSFTYDLTSRGPQRYYLKILVDGVLKFNKRIRVVDKVE